MEPNPLSTTLDTLRSERAVAESRALELKAELEHVGQRLTHLRGAIENIEALLGVPSVEDEEILALADEQPNAGASVREIDFTNTPDGPRKRVPSTEWVAEVVDRIGSPASRNEIYAKFEAWKGIPASWVAPRNSFNNALGRAVERELIQKLADDEFAPKNWNPFEGHTTSDPGGS
jgi:hypothetical protein